MNKKQMLYQHLLFVWSSVNLVFTVILGLGVPELVVFSVLSANPASVSL